MNDVLRRGMMTGAAMAGATMGTMALASAFESRSPWAGFNAMATAIVPAPRVRDGFGSKITPIGIGVLGAGMLVFGLAFEGVRRASRANEWIVAGALAGLAGLAFDEIVLPRWLVPNFRRKMGLVGTIAKYTAVAVAGALCARASQSAPSRGVTMPTREPEISFVHRTTLPMGLPVH